MLIDETVLETARKSRSMLKIAAQNKKNRKHYLKYQAINTLDGMIAHKHGPIGF